MLISRNKNLVVRPIIKQEQNVAGIIIPTETSAGDEQIASGIVVIESGEYKKGMVVYFNKLIDSDILLQLEGDTKEERYFVLQESDIMFSDK